MARRAPGRMVAPHGPMTGSRACRRSRTRPGIGRASSIGRASASTSAASDSGMVATWSTRSVPWVMVRERCLGRHRSASRYVVRRRWHRGLARSPLRGQLAAGDQRRRMNRTRRGPLGARVARLTPPCRSGVRRHPAALTSSRLLAGKACTERVGGRRGSSTVGFMRLDQIPDRGRGDSASSSRYGVETMRAAQVLSTSRHGHVALVHHMQGRAKTTRGRHLRCLGSPPRGNAAIRPTGSGVSLR